MRQVGQGADTSQRGVAMAALLVGLSIMAIMMSVALPAWSHAVRREREAELVWRGEQYRRAIQLFQRKFANTFPPTVDLLVEQKFLRKKYKDPITGEDFQVIPVGAVLRPGGSLPTGGGLGAGTTAPGGQGPGSQTGMGTGPPSNTTMGGIAGQGLGVQGVVSKSREKSIRIYNGASTYDAWFFLGIAGAQQAGNMTAGGGGRGFQNAIRPGLPQNMGLPGSANPLGTLPFGGQLPPGGAGAATPFGTPSSPPPAIPMFGAPANPAPFGGGGPGMPAPGGSAPGPSGVPVFGGGGSRPPVAPPPAWRPR